MTKVRHAQSSQRFYPELSRYPDTPENRVLYTQWYAKTHVTPAVYKAVATLGMSKSDYLAQLQRTLFPHPIVYTSGSTNLSSTTSGTWCWYPKCGHCGTIHSPKMCCFTQLDGTITLSYS